MRLQTLAAMTFLGTVGLLLAPLGCGSPTPSEQATESSARRDGVVPSPGSTPQSTSTTVPSDRSGAPTGSQGMFTLSVTLAQGHHQSGPYAATLSGPGGFTCYMSQSQDNVGCLARSFPAGTSVPIVVTIMAPPLANNSPIWETSGCDSTTWNTCTVLMNANRVVTIKAGRT